MKNTSTTLFVDDFVSGDVPDVCAVTGEPTTDRLVTSTEIDGPSPGWLILLLFPVLGWLILVLVLAFSRRSYLRGELPVSETAYKHHLRVRRWWYAALGAGVLLLLAAMFALRDIAQLGGVTALVGLAALVIGAIGLMRAFSVLPRITLDGSRRWVTVQRVHPAFAAAVAARNERAARLG